MASVGQNLERGFCAPLRTHWTALREKAEPLGDGPGGLPGLAGRNHTVPMKDAELAPQAFFSAAWPKRVKSDAVFGRSPRPETK